MLETFEDCLETEDSLQKRQWVTGLRKVVNHDESASAKEQVLGIRDCSKYNDQVWNFYCWIQRWGAVVWVVLYPWCG